MNVCRSMRGSTNSGFDFCLPMNIDRILTELNHHGVRYLLIGGVNFMLRHKPVLTRGK